MSPDGLLVDTPARLLPGHHVDLVLLSETSQVVRRCCVVHSRIAAIDRSAGPRYRAGLRLASGSHYPETGTIRETGKELPVVPLLNVKNDDDIGADSDRRGTGTQIGKRDSV